MSSDQDLKPGDFLTHRVLTNVHRLVVYRVDLFRVMVQDLFTQRLYTWRLPPLDENYEVVARLDERNVA